MRSHGRFPVIRFPRMASESLKWLEDEWEGVPDPPAPPDPSYAGRRLAVAVLLRAVLDSRLSDPHLRTDAILFLNPRDDRFRQHLQMTLQVSGVDQRWFRSSMPLRDSGMSLSRKTGETSRAPM
jgi:hypothetical protein